MHVLSCGVCHEASSLGFIFDVASFRYRMCPLSMEAAAPFAPFTTPSDPNHIITISYYYHYPILIITPIQLITSIRRSIILKTKLRRDSKSFIILYWELFT